MNKYEQRQHDKELRGKYREAAQVMFPNVYIRPHSAVVLDLDREGAFVECTVWVPKSKVEP